MKAWCQATAKFAEWKPYTNPQTQQSGWLSSDGVVRFDDPRQFAQLDSGTEWSIQQLFAFQSQLDAGSAAKLRSLVSGWPFMKKLELVRDINAHVGGTVGGSVDKLLAWAHGRPI